MAETVTLAPLTSLTNDTSAIATINSNSQLIETAFADCLSLSGSSPNAMEAALDMNGFNILNLPSPATINSPARLIDVVSNPTINLTGTGATYTGAAFKAAIPLGTGSATATWFLDINNSLAYGLSIAGSAAANGTALTSATTSGPTFLPIGNYTTNLSELFTGSTWGPGRWSDGTNQRAPYHYSISSAPTYTGGGFGVGIATAFNGDFSHTPFAAEMWISGASTAGTPSTGYAQTPPNQIPIYLEYFTNSGHNQSTTAPTGRTGQYAQAIDLFHAGAGDAIAYGANIFVNATSTGTGASGILANPAGAMFGATIATSTAGNILQVGQVTMIDNGVDAAGLGWNVTSNRTVTTGANGAWWNAYRSQSIGSGFVDVGYQCTGAHKIGLDTSFATLPVSGNWQQAALTLAQSQRIYLNATPTDPSGYSTFPSTAGSIYFDYNGTNIEFTAGLTSTGLIKSSNATGGVGYSTGAGGAVSQLTSKATGVTLNKVTGQITTFTSSLAAGATVVFTFTNSTIAATDTILIQQTTGVQPYSIYPTTISAGTANIAITNNGSTASEAIVLNYTVIKGANS